MRTMIMTAALGTALVTGTLCADFAGLTAERFVGDGWVCNGFDGLTAWRIYANFDGRGDEGVIAVFAQPGSPLSMRSSNGRFENAPPPFDSVCAPEDLTEDGIWVNQWDTYVTIGRTDAAGTKCGLDKPGECFGQLEGDFDCLDGGLFVTLEDDESHAVDGRVLLGQFAVEEGESVTGRFNLLLRNNEVWKDVEIVPIDCAQDLDGSRDIGFGDLLVVLSKWGPCEPPCGACLADLSGNRDVGFEDLLIVLGAWGDC